MSPEQLGITFLNCPYSKLFEERNVNQVWTELLDSVVVTARQGALSCVLSAAGISLPTHRGL